MTHIIDQTTTIRVAAGDLISTGDEYFTIPTKGRYHFAFEGGKLKTYERLVRTPAERVRRTLHWFFDSASCLALM